LHKNIGAVYALEKKYPEATREYEKALSLAPDRIDALVALTQIDLLQGNEKKALERAQQHLPKTKNQAQVYELLGQISLRSKEYGKGIEYFDRAVNLNPDLASAYYALGNAFAAQQKFAAAIEQYEMVIRKSPQAIPPHMMLGILYELQKQPAKANEFYRKVLEIKKDFSPAANQLAWNYAEHGGNLDVAMSLAQKARETSPNDPVIADTLGWIYYKKGVYQSAIALLKESNEKFKNSNPTVLYHLGAAYAKNKDTALARETLKKALSVSQNFADAAETRKLLNELQSLKNS
jgi:tetratricopeptide (TPR) repeat protein